MRIQGVPYLAFTLKAKAKPLPKRVFKYEPNPQFGNPVPHWDRSAHARPMLVKKFNRLPLHDGLESLTTLGAVFHHIGKHPTLNSLVTLASRRATNISFDAASGDAVDAVSAQHKIFDLYFEDDVYFEHEDADDGAAAADPSAADVLVAPKKQHASVFLDYVYGSDSFIGVSQ